MRTTFNTQSGTLYEIDTDRQAFRALNRPDPAWHTYDTLLIHWGPSNDRVCFVRDSKTTATSSVVKWENRVPYEAMNVIDARDYTR